MASFDYGFWRETSRILPDPVGSFRHGREFELRRRTVLKPDVRGVWRPSGLFTLDARLDNGLNDVNILRLPHFAIKQAAGVPVHWD